MKRTDNNQAVVKFAVEDSGVGICAEEHEKLFQMFGKAKFGNELNPEGIGLGLTICKKISEKLGG